MLTDESTSRGEITAADCNPAMIAHLSTQYSPSDACIGVDAVRPYSLQLNT